MKPDNCGTAGSQWRTKRRIRTPLCYLPIGHLSEEGQKVLAVELGKGVAMTGLPVKYKEFQVEPDYVVAAEFGNQLKQYMTEFQKLLGYTG